MYTDNRIEVLREGDESGNDMIIKTVLSSGREIFGFATMNAYGGGWDLGPTWNYYVSGSPGFLLDTGRRGMGGKLIQMMSYAGISEGDLKAVALSHGHEDHDGGLFEVASRTGATVWAHGIYRDLIGIYPEKAPCPEKRQFPASCWHCLMPESFSHRFCLDYHQERLNLKVHPIGEGEDHPFGEGISVFHVPGHAPDALAFLIDEEVLLVGDTVLPDITPHPSREDVFNLTGRVLSDDYDEPDRLYGLRAYLKSLEILRDLGEKIPRLLTLPAHRLYYEGKWNLMVVEERIAELVAHHSRRCSEVLDILVKGGGTPQEIARKYFDPSLLEGFGINLAVNEILSHCELLAKEGKVIFAEGEKIAARN